MALNQVIHGSNRVVENPNRYKLNAVSGQANTYDLEKMPGIITDNGTPYNKIILDKIDNVLSYLTPSYEKVITGEGEYSGETPILSNEEENWTLTDKKMNSVTVQYNVGVEINFIQDYASGYGSYKGLIKYFNSIGESAGYTSDSATGSSGTPLNIFEINFTNFVRIKKIRGAFTNRGINTSASYVGTVRFYGVTEEGTEELLTTFSNNHTNQTYEQEVPNEKFYKKYLLKHNGYQSNNGNKLKIANFNITSWDLKSTKYENKFTLDNNGYATLNPYYQKKEHLNRNWIISQDGLSMINDDGIEISVPSVYSSSYQINNIADGDINTGYLSQTVSAGTTQNIIIDFKQNYKLKSISTFYQRDNTDLITKFQYSLDNQNWFDLFELNRESQLTKHITNYELFRYIRINVYFLNQENVSINEIDFEYENEKYLDVPFINNQRLLIETSSKVDTYLTDTNTLNNVEIDTMLTPLKYYELLYNQQSGKFIAEEVRNDS